MEELLLEILDHLLEAQEDGKTAHDIFGEDLKAYCDELIKSSEHQNSFQQAAVIGFAVSLLLSVQIGYDTFTTLIQNYFQIQTLQESHLVFLEQYYLLSF